MIDRFRQAEAQYQRLNEDVVAGAISLEQFRQQLGQIRVLDEQGRTWMLQEGTGQWFVWQNGQWAPGEPYPNAAASAQRAAPPPNYGASSGAPAYAQGSQAVQQRQLEPLEGGWGRVFSKTLGAGAIALVFAEVIAVVISIFSDEVELAQMALYMLAPAALSMLVTFFNLSSQWRGRIVSFVTKREQDTGYDDDVVRYKNVTYARLQLENGRSKDVKPPRDWQVGDVIEKRRGEWGSKKL